jgi:hypothetical protein
MDAIPDPVRELLAHRIDSVAQLEIVLLLHGAPDTPWTAEAVSDELRIDRTWVAQELVVLADRGFLIGIEGSTPRYRFRAEATELARAVTALAGCYADRRVSVVALLYSRTTA